MAVGANTYGSAEGVERLVGDLVTGRAFGAGTTPTVTQVEAVLDDVAADLNRELDAAGYTVPVATADATARAFLVAANNFGASAVVLGMLPFGGFDPETAEAATSRAGMFQGHLNHAIKMISERRLRASMSIQRTVNLFAGSQENSDGDTKSPLFKRGDDDYPGRRSLTE